MIITNLLRLGMIVLGLLASISISSAQQARKPAPTAAELKKNIAQINSQGEEGDGDVLIEQTAKRLATYLKSHELSAAEANKLGLELSVDSKDATQFRIYTFDYHSGGTRGQVNRPVMQWKNQAGKLFAYAPAIECGFYEIHKLNSLGRTMYLLLGQEQGSSRDMHYIAHVVAVNGDYLLLDTPAFDQRASLTLCNVTLEFDARQQVLRLDVTDFDFDYFQPEDEPYQLLKQWGFINLTETRTLALKFNGQRFVKP
ncbi:hypothetical protein [Hymenobacter guriensis]|uniref:DUF1571 domain-containing protein n=1 Tax=Hymenobacter guriensis TaxID=2793065 RepID=A0ABS0KXH0_9BACT|nr:hypothetical protein [Hymenobacter guriensis]MBG8552551.1 hypothetical protein [Hymenobacter guriensis]